MQNEAQDNLSDFEDRLRSLPLPAARVDRDEVMYRAGKAAALASMSATTVSESDSNPSLETSPNLRSQWQWKTAVATLATVSCVLAGLLVQQNPEGGTGNDNVVDSGLIASGELPSVEIEAKQDVADNVGIHDPSTTYLLANNQPTFFQSIFGKLLLANQENISQQRIDQVLNATVERKRLDAESETYPTTSNFDPPKRTLIRASVNSLLQDMLLTPK